MAQELGVEIGMYRFNSSPPFPGHYFGTTKECSGKDASLRTGAKLHSSDSQNPPSGSASDHRNLLQDFTVVEETMDESIILFLTVRCCLVKPFIKALLGKGSEVAVHVSLPSRNETSSEAPEMARVCMLGSRESAESTFQRYDDATATSSYCDIHALQAKFPHLRIHHSKQGRSTSQAKAFHHARILDICEPQSRRWWSGFGQSSRAYNEDDGDDMERRGGNKAAKLVSLACVITDGLSLYELVTPVKFVDPDRPQVHP